MVNMVKRINLKSANVARSNTICDINRQIILSHIREKSAISRVEIARFTALQWSTVSLNVEELKSIGLIEGESSGGRPPQLLSLRTAHAVVVGVDLGKKRTVVATYVKSLKKQNGAGKISFTQLVNLVLAGDEKELMALKETAHYIGVGIANLFQGLSPEVAIITGTVVRAWSLIIEDILAGAKSATCQSYPAVKIIPSTLGAYPTLMGAFSLILTDKLASVSIA